MTDYLLAAVLVAWAFAWVLLAVRLEQRRARQRLMAARRTEFWAQMADSMRARRRGKRLRPKVDARIQRRRYAP